MHMSLASAYDTRWSNRNWGGQCTVCACEVIDSLLYGGYGKCKWACAVVVCYVSCMLCQKIAKNCCGKCWEAGNPLASLDKRASSQAREYCSVV